MEACGRISEEWGSLSGLYTAEEADFMNQLLGNNCSVPEELLYENSTLEFPCGFWPGHDSTVVSVTGINHNNTSYFPSNDANFFSFSSQGSSPSTDSGVSYHLNDPLTNFDAVSMDFSLGDAKIVPYTVETNDHLNHQMNENTDEESGFDLVERVLAVADKNFQANKECEELVSSEPVEKKSDKRSRVSWEGQKNKRNVKSKKNTKSESVSKNEEDNRSFQRQSSSSCCSEDDSNASQELNVGSTSSLSPKDSASLKSNNVKSLSAKSPATDPQSVYARRRRERINERLRILQNLVPNGTKVDISTMLEEAVRYVKFLQLQIKLLSSDDLWMYAPIASNGLNIGIDLNITPKQS